MGRVVKRTFSVIANNPITFGALSLVVGIPLLALQWNSLQFSAGLFRDGRFDSSALQFYAIAWFVYLLSSFVLQAGTIHATVVYLNGRTASLADCLATGISALLQLVLITLLMLLGFMAGAILLVVPAIILMIMWIVAVPACVVERTGVLGALRRSRALTRGYRWPIFGLYVVFFIVGVIIALVLEALTGMSLLAPANATAVSPTILQMTGSVVGTMASAIIGSTLIASIYYELRQIKEGIGPEALASVFD
jgi:hypothetical protein